MSGNRCLICGRPSEAAKVLKLKELVHQETFSIVRCPHCSVMRTVPVPEALQSYYASDFGKIQNAPPIRIHLFLKNILLNRELRRITSKVHPGLLVDIGCGTGDFIHLMHKKGLPVIAADAARERPCMIQTVGSVPYCEFNFDRYELSGLNQIERFAQAPPDRRVFVLRHVLEHVKDPRAFLERMAAYGASHFYIAVPNAASFGRHILGPYWAHWSPPLHLWHFDIRSLRSLLDRLKIEIMDFGYDTIPLLLPSLYCFLRLNGFPPGLYNLLNPKGAISSLSAPLDFLIPGNVLWVLAKARGSS